jgi:RHS repeat-associated protein
LGNTASHAWDDGNGNVTGDGTRNYTYDQEGDGHIVTATGTGLNASYTYDPLGRRYSKTVNGQATTYFLHDERGNEIAEYTIGGGGQVQVQNEYIYDSIHTAPIAVMAGGAITYNFFDRLGSVVGIANTAGTQVLGEYATLPYGDSNPPNIAACAPGTCGSGAGTAFGFAGYRYDPESGLYHTGARYYDPRLGRFLQPDPIGQAGGVNLYAYVGNDPLNGTDPQGLYVHVDQNGNVITLTLPIQYTGAPTPAMIQSYNEGISSVWSGQIGKYTVTTLVVSPIDECAGRPSKYDKRCSRLSVGKSSVLDIRRRR